MNPPASGQKYAPVRFRLIALLLAVSLFALSIPQGFIPIIQTAEAASPNVVISQIYGGGGNAGATYKNDFIELFNRGTTTVSLAGWSVQYASSTGTSWSVTSLSGSIAPGKYYLIQEAAGTGGTVNLPTPEASGTIAMSATAGKVAVVNSTTALTGGCPAAVDFVGFGGANCFEGANPTPALTNTTAAIRGGNGCNDTDVNSADFTTGSPNPRNSSTPAQTCGVTNAAPTINAVADPAKTVSQDAPAFTITLTGSDDNNVFNWGATGSNTTGIAAVQLTAGQGTSSAVYTVTLQSGFSGTASFTASLSDNVNPAATRTVNIAVTPAVANNPPAIGAVVNPVATVAQDAAPFSVSLNGSDDNNIFNWSATAGAGVSSAVVSAGQGTSAVTYTVTLQPGFSGTAAFTAKLSDNVNPQVSQVVNITVTPAPPPPLDHIVISQVYGGGGNASATFRNDFVELYNPTTAAVDLGGWTIQYGSATGTTWQAQPLGGVMQPGEYYLISLGSGGTIGALLPPANISGNINLSATTGKVALSSYGDPFSGCPVGDPTLVDLVGFGTTANCREGAGNAPAPSNTTSIFRKNGGFTDTNVNSADFVTGAPNPRRTTPIVELAPSVLSSDPRANFNNAPRDANITVTFTEPVDISDGWFNISCVTTGAHNSATVATGGANSWIIIPNVNFQPGEQCTVNVVKEFVHDSDLDDNTPAEDQLSKNYSATFTISTGTAPAYTPDVHLTMGNPSNAVADKDNSPNNYLMVKPEFTLSYNRDRGTPNWVSWHLADEWVGTLERVDTFRADPAVPADWYRVTHVDYANSGFDRGHMTPNADRDPETSSPINQATFLMSNMVPQAPDNNQGPWADMENYLRTLLPTNEVYIVAGGAGIGGTGSNGGTTNTIAGGHVTVPAQTWKVALVIPKQAGDDVSRVTCGTRTIAVIMPNVQGIRNNDWQSYITTVDAVEQLTGYDLYSNLPDAVEACAEAGTNGANPPGTTGQSVTVVEDAPQGIALEAVSPDNGALTYIIVQQPAHGTLSGSGPNVTYTPAPDYNGADTFTFKVTEGLLTSNTSTVTITVTEVNDAPVANADGGKTTDEDTALSFPAGDLTSNDSAGPAGEADQTLTVASVTGGANTHGAVSLAGGQVIYTPEANYHGPAGFNYEVCDDGTTSGAPASKCATATVSVTVQSVNDRPVASAASATTAEDTSVTVNVLGNVSDADGDTLSVSAVTQGAHGVVTNNGDGTVTYAPAANSNGPDSFNYTVSDGNDGGTVTATISVSVSPVNDAPVLGPVGNHIVLLGETLAFTAVGSDIDTAAAGLSYSLTGSVPAGALINPVTGAFSWTPTAAQAGNTYTFGVRVTDDGGLSDEKPISVGVGYNWSGFLQPIDNQGKSIFKLGQTIPVKFQLTGASAGFTNVAARLFVAKITDEIVGDEEVAGSTSNATEGNLFRYADGSYIFNLSTTGLSKGTYQLRIDMGDGVSRTVLVSLR